MLKKSIICFVMIGGVVLALASSGGGKNKNSGTLGSGFTPIRTTNGFTLKAGPNYSGSFTSQARSGVLHNTILTYQKGNTIFILPYDYKMKNPGSRSNLNLLTLRVKLHK
jgi:hypothetical protein